MIIRLRCRTASFCHWQQTSVTFAKCFTDNRSCPKGKTFLGFSCPVLTSTIIWLIENWYTLKARWPLYSQNIAFELKNYSFYKTLLLIQFRCELHISERNRRTHFSSICPVYIARINRVSEQLRRVPASASKPVAKSRSLIGTTHTREIANTYQMPNKPEVSSNIKGNICITRNCRRFAITVY